MTTLAKSSANLVQTEAGAATASWYERFLAEATFNYYFLISFAITFGSCLGGITAMYILQNDAPVWQLCLNIYVTMGSNVACIGQASTKWVMRIFGLSVLANIVLLLVNVL
jgi:hypothetical protein